MIERKLIKWEIFDDSTTFAEVACPGSPVPKMSLKEATIVFGDFIKKLPTNQRGRLRVINKLIKDHISLNKSIASLTLGEFSDALKKKYPIEEKFRKSRSSFRPALITLYRFLILKEKPRLTEMATPDSLKHSSPSKNGNKKEHDFKFTALDIGELGKLMPVDPGVGRLAKLRMAVYRHLKELNPKQFGAIDPGPELKNNNKERHRVFANLSKFIVKNAKEWELRFSPIDEIFYLARIKHWEGIPNGK